MDNGSQLDWLLAASGYNSKQDLIDDYNVLHVNAARRWLATRGYTPDQLDGDNLNTVYIMEQGADKGRKMYVIGGYTQEDMMTDPRLAAKMLMLSIFRQLGITVDAGWPLMRMIEYVGELGYDNGYLQRRFPGGTDITFYMDVDPLVATQIRRALLQWINRIRDQPNFIRSTLRLLGYSTLNVTDGQAPVGLTNIINGMTDSEVFRTLYYII